MSYEIRSSPESLQKILAGYDEETEKKMRVLTYPVLADMIIQDVLKKLEKDYHENHTNNDELIIDSLSALSYIKDRAVEGSDEILEKINRYTKKLPRFANSDSVRYEINRINMHTMPREY